MEITHRFFLKLWPQMRLGATVTTRKQNKHQANGERLILQNQRRPERFDQMLRSCWLVFFMLIELCTSNLFLLDKLWINNFIWRCSKITQQCTEKTTRNVEQRWMVPSPRQCPCPHGSVQQFLAKKHVGYSSSSVFTRPCAMRLFFHVPAYEMRDERETFCWCQRSEKENDWGLEQHQHWRVPEMFSAVGKKNVGTSVSSQKDSTQKETRVVIV